MGDGNLIFNGHSDVVVADDELTHGIGQILTTIRRANWDDDAIGLNRTHPHQGEQQAQ